MSINPFKAVSDTFDSVSEPLKTAKKAVSNVTNFMDTKTEKSYTDIGKLERDAMSKDFPAGTMSVTNKSKLSDGSSLSVNATRGGGVSGSGPIDTDLKHSFLYPRYKADITTKLRSDGLLTSNAEFKDLVGPGIKLLAIGTLTASGKQKLKMGAEYHHGPIFSSGIFDLDKQLLAADVAYRVDKNILVGGEAAYDASRGHVKEYNVAAQYSAHNYTVSLHALNSLNLFSVHYWQRVNSNIDAFGSATSKKSYLADMSLRGKEVQVGVKYTLNKDQSAKAKANSNGKVGLAYSHRVKDGITITVGGSFNSSNLNLDSRKIGLAIALDG